MNRIFQNIYNDNLSLMRKVIIWSIINSILLFSLLGFEQENFSTSAKQNDAYISIAAQNILEQNIYERNLRQKNSENIYFSIDPVLCSFTSQIFLSDSYQIINYVRSFGSILVSSPNNHSLRSPPINSI